MITRDGLKKLYFSAKHLRTKQVFYRLYYKCFKINSKIKSPGHSDLAKWNKNWNAPSKTMQYISKDGHLCFINQTVSINNIIWNDPNRTKLWLYNLHYFDILDSTQATSHCDLLFSLYAQWIKENPPSNGNGWEPYPLSLRIVNVIKWVSKFNRILSEEWRINLLLQAEALVKQVEYHIAANHLFANAKALVFLGTFFKGTRADFYLNKGLKILNKELEIQFLPDGGHFELSPMYHATLIWDLCDLVHLTQCTDSPKLLKLQPLLEKRIQKGLYWLQCMSHPDGEISLFNDAAFGIAPTIKEVENYAHQLKIIQNPVRKSQNTPMMPHYLPDSGYYAVDLEQKSKLILDVAKVGPDFQPGHAHADTLSFELSLYSQRFLVHSGTSTYAPGAQRLLERGTRAHNTVEINAENSSEIWSEFRVARRANPKGLTIETLDNKITITCAHDGYTRLAQPVTHHREWIISPKAIQIKDKLTGSYTKAISLFHFHPEIRIMELGNSNFECYLPQGQKVLLSVKGGKSCSIESSTWHPNFGISIDNRCLVVEFANNELITEINWAVFV